MKNFAISAIHTDSGKTCVSIALCKIFGVEYFKLVQAGKQTDASRLEEFGIKTQIGAFLKTPASPHLGMQIENIKYDGLKLKPKNSENTLIELAGGLYTPLDDKNFMIDYLKAHNLPTFLVVNDYLGSINHAVMSIKSLQNEGIKILAVIISNDKFKKNLQFVKDKFPDLNFFELGDIYENFNASLDDLKSQILSSNLKELL